MQRLFSTFAGGAPGRGLFILRVAISLFLVHDCFPLLKEGTSATMALPFVVAAALGVLLLVGLWTPIAGALIAAMELWVLFLNPDRAWTSGLAAAAAAATALVGPGAWSLDAFAYGRRRISIRGR